jgi:hypothetical protein
MREGTNFSHYGKKRTGRMKTGMSLLLKPSRITEIIIGLISGFSSRSLSKIAIFFIVFTALKG